MTLCVKAVSEMLHLKNHKWSGCSSAACVQITNIVYSVTIYKPLIVNSFQIFGNKVIRTSSLKKSNFPNLVISKTIQKILVKTIINIHINMLLQSGAASIDIIERGQGRLYTPPVSKLNNLAKKNYLGKAKVCLQRSEI